MKYTATPTFLIVVLLALGCGLRAGTSDDRTSSPVAPTQTPAQSRVDSPGEPEKAAQSSACRPVTMPGKVFVAKQSFKFDHEPFRGACFVTFASRDEMVDEKDVPRGSTFHIYRNDKKVYDFPDAFGGQPACWVEAVSFKDLNGDGRTDVIIAGKCLAARDSYPSNAVFANNGSEFTTNEQSNSQLDELKTAAEIEAYVKRNQSKFF